jgi:hypothetical protein
MTTPDISFGAWVRVTPPPVIGSYGDVNDAGEICIVDESGQERWLPVGSTVEVVESMPEPITPMAAVSDRFGRIWQKWRDGLWRCGDPMLNDDAYTWAQIQGYGPMTQLYWNANQAVGAM